MKTDNEKLILDISRFTKECKKRGKPIIGYTLREAYPGVTDSSYFFAISAEWITKDNVFEAIEFFTNVMFDKMRMKSRRKIFSIKVYPT